MAAIFSYLPIPANAGDRAAYDALHFRAYAHFRSAAFYLRTKNPDLAAFELESMRAHWGKIVATFADDPPDGYSQDARWKATLQEVQSDIASGLVASNEGKIDPARETLRRIHRTLATLRQRNNIRTHSDCVDDMNRAMDSLFKYRRNPPDFGSPASMADFQKEVATVTAYYRRCRDEAPNDLRQHPEFARMFDGALESLGRIDTAIAAKNREAIINILREIRSFDRMIYLRFG